MTVRWTDKPGGGKLVSASHGLELREESMSTRAKGIIAFFVALIGAMLYVYKTWE